MVKNSAAIFFTFLKPKEMMHIAAEINNLKTRLFKNTSERGNTKTAYKQPTLAAHINRTQFVRVQISLEVKYNIK